MGILHHVPFEEMTIRYDWQASRIGDTFDLQGGSLLFGMAAEPKELNFTRSGVHPLGLVLREGPTDPATPTAWRRCTKAHVQVPAHAMPPATW
ncbi:MAG: hypothetical protein R3F17_07585 [Planctomycetota bacterium]